MEKPAPAVSASHAAVQRRASTVDAPTACACAGHPRQDHPVEPAPQEAPQEGAQGRVRPDRPHQEHRPGRRQQPVRGPARKGRQRGHPRRHRQGAPRLHAVDHRLGARRLHTCGLPPRSPLNRQSPALLFRARRPTSRRPRLPRRRAPSLPPAGSLGPSSARPTCSASLASSRCSASEPRLRSPRTLPPPRFSPRSGTRPRLPFPQSQRRSRRHRSTASARLAATTPARLQPSPLRTACPPTTRCLLARAC